MIILNGCTIGPLLFSIVNKVYFHILSWPVWCLLHKIQGTITILKFGTRKLNYLFVLKGTVRLCVRKMQMEWQTGYTLTRLLRSGSALFAHICLLDSVPILRILWKNKYLFLSSSNKRKDFTLINDVRNIA